VNAACVVLVWRLLRLPVHVYGCRLQAVKRSGDYAGGDAVEEAIMAMVKKDIDDGSIEASSSSSRDASGGGAFDLATATHWPGVAKQQVLVAPHEARVAWREFMGASALAVQQVSCGTWHVVATC
jgi:hypothetical protein